MMLKFGIAALAALQGVFAVSIPETSIDLTNSDSVKHALHARERVAARSSCGNTPTTRGQWCPGFDITTDYDYSSPNTGVTVNYAFHISRVACSPDGASTKQCTLINGQYPGPTITANWGDTIQVVVYNDIPDNGTQIHWHGIRQLHSNPNDGANGITECPIPPGSSRTYTFLATQYGSSWYHSHHSAQYGEGVVGTILINGPTTANYDIDLGPLPVTDWFYNSSWTLDWIATHVPGPPPPSQNVLFNGTMVSAQGTGKYNVITITQGKVYKLRLTNTAVDHDFVFTLDGHPFTAVAVDFVPIVPRTGLTQVTLGIGQRMDIIFTANATIGNYWLRALPGCGSPPGALSGRAQIYNANPPIVVGSIIRYVGAPATNPTSTQYTVTNNCDDEPSTPYWSRTIPSAPFLSTVQDYGVTFGATQRNGENLFTWFVNGSTMVANWSKPTLQYVLQGNNNFPSSFNLYSVNGASTTYFYFVIQTTGLALPHPIHLHGHDFWVLGSGTGIFNTNSTSGLNFNNPKRRDTAILPPGGYLVLTFPMDNPGAWLLHCHIGWHVSQGFSIQFLENANQIAANDGPFTQFNNGCTAWNNFYNSPARVWAEDDSGL